MAYRNLAFSIAVVATATSVHASSCTSNATIDPPSFTRSGDDVASVPLTGSNASIQGCIALCCETPGCVAFSYNDPQPVHTCVGPQCCEQGDSCCMLKGSVPPLVNNTYGPAVKSGVVPPRAAAPGPTPPFPPSTLITSVTFGNVSWWGNGQNQGDTWPSVWAADGTLYAWACDNLNNSPMSLYNITGDPYKGEPLVPGLVAANPIDFASLCGPLGKTGPYPYINVKPGGAIALPDGSMRTGVSCMNYGDDAPFNRQHNLAGFVAKSSDGGVTWTNTTAVGSFSGRLAAPVFVSCGQANAPCAGLGVLYAFFPGSVDDAAYWDNNDALFLGRVAPASVDDASAYEFFAGLDGGGAPQWTPDARQAQPSLYFGRMVGEDAVFFNPYLGRYVVANFGLIDNEGAPRPWHTEPFMSPHRTQLTMYESVNPWGPWSLFFRDDDSVHQAPGMYTPTFPAAYHRPVVEGEATMVMFFSCLGGAPTCRYTLNWQAVTLGINATSLAPA